MENLIEVGAAYFIIAILYLFVLDHQAPWGPWKVNAEKALKWPKHLLIYLMTKWSV